MNNYKKVLIIAWAGLFLFNPLLAVWLLVVGGSILFALKTISKHKQISND